MVSHICHLFMIHRSISHPSKIELETIPSKSHPECANVAEISNLQLKEKTKNLVWLTAKDQLSGQVLNAEIKVSKISKIEIFSRFKQFNLGDRAHIEVRATDDEGNTFSCLDGFKFEWQVSSGHQNIMRMSLKDTAHKKTHNHQHHDELSALQKDDFFFESL